MREAVKKYIAFALVAGFAFIFGFVIGAQSTLNFIIRIGAKMLRSMGVNADFDPNQIAIYISNYKHIIENCVSNVTLK